MKKSVQLKQQRAAIVREQQTVLDKARTEKRDFTDEEMSDLEKKDGEIEDLDKEIEKAEKNEAREQRIAEMAARSVGNDFDDKPEDREAREIFQRVSLSSVLRELSSKNGLELKGAQKELHQIGLEENRLAGVVTPEDTAFAIPLRAVARATQQTVSEDSGEYGGELVQDQSLRMVQGLRPKLFLEDLGATFFLGLTGGDLPLISSDAFSMEFMGEVASITPQKQKFAGKILSPKRVAGAVDLSNRLLMQSSTDVEAWIMRELRNALGVTIQRAAINGTGVGANPKGLLQMTNINLAADSSAVVASHEKLIELQGLIEENDAGETSLGYLIHPKIKAILKVLKLDAGSGRFLFEDNSIDAIKTVSSSLLPLLTDVYPVIYGDWKELFMGQWGSLNIQANPYSADLSNSTRFVFNTYADSEIVNEKAFAVNKWIKPSTT